MNQTTQFQAPKAASHVWAVFKRTLAAIVVLIATIAFVVNAAGLVGVWIIRQPARDTVTALSTFVNDKLGTVDQALARISAGADEVRQALAHVDGAAGRLGDRIEEGSPLLAALIDTAREDLTPRIAEMRAQAAAVHDAALSVNAALETLDSFPFLTVPTFSGELSAVSKRVDAAQLDAQELRVAIDEARAGASAKLIAAVTARTSKIDNVISHIKSTMVTYQSVVAQKRQQVTDLSRRVLRGIDLLILSLTALFVVVAAGQVLLIYMLWQYVRRGRFPVLRVA